MKTLLLPAFLLASLAASAQAPKSFGDRTQLDALQKKLRDRFEQRYPKMPNAFAPGKKPLLLQTPGISVDSLGTVILPYKPLQAPGIIVDSLGNVTLPFKPLQGTPGTYSLPQDGMPCIVPDTNGIAAMPNATPGRFHSFRSDMPNAHVPAPEDKVRK
ncbi:hypothetical protein [Flaviaesturariibacter amylovorans]|uniref:Uncharacterized protein n=1 Tax=Flaviaesturariibacter amylovorans TaxID=1084520 RepID=A0ABP8G7U7_9BACT